MPLRVTIHDIAAACGLSKSTVARVLSNHPSVRPATREAVMAKARELAYTPDPSLRVLAQHRWNRPYQKGPPLALVAMYPKGERASGAPAPSLLVSLQAAARRFGYDVEEFHAPDYASMRKLARVIHARGIRGLILPPVVRALDWTEWDWSLFSAVGCGIGEFRLPIHSVDINFFSATRLCWRHCVERGYRRIGACLYRQPGPDTNDSLRHAAVLYEQSRLPANHARIPIYDGGFYEMDKFARWFRANRPDAVIALSELTFWHLRELGVRVPADVGFCVITHVDQSSIGSAGAGSQRARIADGAITWLDQLLRTNETGLPAVPDEILIEPQWIDGETLPPARG